ncbi:MAG: SDR family oxidoreductase [Alphaproteobacteria bacterium]
MPTVLITGANRGIGLEFVRQYAAQGWTVLATCRDPDRARSLKALEAEVLALDVNDVDAIAALGASLAGRTVDLLINNAGLYGDRNQSLGHVDPDEWMQVLRVNAMAPLKLAEALIGSLEMSTRPVVANVTSLMGSMADNGSGGAYIYRSSKAALNAVTKSLAVDLAGRSILVVALHPGWVQTDMGGPGALINVETSVSGMRQVLHGLKRSDSGRFLNYRGEELPW